MSLMDDFFTRRPREGILKVLHKLLAITAGQCAQPLAAILDYLRDQHVAHVHAMHELQ